MWTLPRLAVIRPLGPQLQWLLSASVTEHGEMNPEKSSLSREVELSSQNGTFFSNEKVNLLMNTAPHSSIYLSMSLFNPVKLTFKIRWHEGVKGQ